LDRVYPKEHRALAHRIAERGVLLSEYALGTAPLASNFPQRNRIISGLSRGVIVVEAELRSGSLITARLAGEQGRDVFAVPGSPLDPRAEGTNDLLRQGATLCTSSLDVQEALAPILRDGLPEPGSLFETARETAEAEPLWDELELFEEPVPTTIAGHEMDEDPAPPLHPPAAQPRRVVSSPAQVASLLGPSPVTIDDLARLSGVSLADVRMALLDLELEGRLEWHGVEDAGVEAVANNTGVYGDVAGVGIEVAQFREVATGVDDEAGADGLPCEGCASGPWGEGNAMSGRQSDDGLDVR
jgi:DNA processing protein